MRLYAKGEKFKLYNGNMLEMKEVIPNGSIDSIVCDPPYELNFMCKGWDNSGIAFDKNSWKQCYDALKEGGYLLAFGGSRTYHRIACAIEDAGFEIRDTIMWLYGSGFPKSMSLSKGLEAKEKLGNAGSRNKRIIEQQCDTEEYSLKQTNCGAMGEIIETTRKEYIPNTDLAKQWRGWGTCLKPAFEPIIVARKPFKGSLVDNVIKNGVGGINIDECRVGEEYEKEVNGRFPANVILTYDDTDFEEVCGGFPNTKGDSRKSKPTYDKGFWSNAKSVNSNCLYNDSGCASRYFYCAKASKKDRDEGLDKFKNTHPTVKPTTLMQYLVRLVTPKGGIICDPFMGSGSTGKAVMLENKERDADYKFIGIELTDEYLPICEARVSLYAEKEDTIDDYIREII